LTIRRLLAKIRLGKVHFICVLLNLYLFDRLTGQLADKPTRGQSSCGLDNSWTGQLADNEFF